MSARCLILLGAVLPVSLLADLTRFPETQAMTTPAPTQRRHATTTVTVRHSEAKPFDQTEKPLLNEISIEEKFEGDIEGESVVRALQIAHDDRSATMVSVQRVRGRIGNRSGTFVLQGAETIKQGKIHATWSVVPNSGTGGLVGLRGEGGFEGEFGKGSGGFLEYWFE